MKLRLVVLVLAIVSSCTFSVHAQAAPIRLICTTCDPNPPNPPSPPISNVTPPTGTTTLSNGTYFQWQYQIGPKTIMVIIENGVKVPGLYQFLITLPTVYNIANVHAVADYAPWCSDQGDLWHVDALTPAGVLEFMFGDKFFTIPGSPSATTHVSYNYPASPGLQTQTLQFTYFTDGSCQRVTNSLVVFMNLV